MPGPMEMLAVLFVLLFFAGIIAVVVKMIRK